LVLSLLSIAIALFCIVSIVFFAKFKQRDLQFEPLTESEEKFLAIQEIRKKIRKLVKKGDSENVDEIEKL
jgi:hypothetical protein